MECQEFIEAMQKMHGLNYRKIDGEALWDTSPSSTDPKYTQSGQVMDAFYVVLLGQSKGFDARSNLAECCAKFCFAICIIKIGCRSAIGGSALL